MKREEDFSTLDEFDLRILRFIYQVLYHPTRKDVEEFFFPDGPIKTRYVERRLQYLVEQKYISFHELETANSPVRTRGYYLLTRGARGIGVELKRSDSKVKKQPELKKAITDLTILAHRLNLEISANETTCRKMLVEQIQRILFSEGREVNIRDLFELLPKRVLPDLVLRTQEETFICIVANPSGEEDYFKRREDKYKECKRFFRFIIIALSERQCRSAVKALKDQCSYLSEKREFDNSCTFLIFHMSEIHKIPDFI